ncbi:PstS family phosphate ABC transporter substrate-binding protein [Sporosarcina jiandibaonis]|uniref:PstS family phosphate ABC transporter substrate-binding protein n=1 Tax=Sporosarcina jiandibaonis TaxID=2715535 RepID=UPI0015576AF1|nr:substrate-binding domain-containing protein [Sporosarcina jiandibaonis]
MPFLIPFIVVLYISAGFYFTIRFFSLKKPKNAIYRILGVTIALSLIYTIPGFYEKTRATVQDGDVDTYAYAPFSKASKVVSLSEPSTYKIEDNLPIIDGATALYPVYSAFVKAVYPEKEYDQYDSEVMSNRTGQAYDNLINGDVDMIFALAPSDAQLNRAKDQGRELKLTPIGKEAFVFFVNAKNPVTGLTTDEVKGIYSGEITNWKEVGGKDKTIRAFQRPEDSGSQTALQQFMGEVPIMDPPVEDIASLMGTIVDQVSDYKNFNNAMGYTFRYYSTEMTQNKRIRLLALNDVEPTIETIRSGAYPITGEFYAITAGSENPHLEKFIEWMLSEQGQEIIEKTGYVSIQ